MILGVLGLVDDLGDTIPEPERGNIVTTREDMTLVEK